jgi:hypothetical protein
VQLLLLVTQIVGTLSKPPDFVFGFSTGHMGTTALTLPKTYGHPNNIVFLFEHVRLETERWKLMTLNDELTFVRKTVFPSLRHNNKTVVDLGHYVNYYLKALLTYILTETTHTVALVYIVRERKEAAISLSSTSGSPKSDLCDQLFVRLCPYDRPEDVVIKIPGGASVWRGFSKYQQAMWMLDETEARFRLYAEQFPSVKTIKVSWTKQQPNSLADAARAIAALLETDEAKVFINEPVKVHAGIQSTNITLLRQIELEDKAYRRIMYNYTNTRETSGLS